MTRVVIEAVHLDQIREHGGLPGLRDDGLLESALARPQHKWTYQRKPDLATLAAAYGYGLITNHPFRDGNKRIGFLAVMMFLGLNGHTLAAEEAEVVTTIVATAAGHQSEAALAKWIRRRMVRTQDQ